MSEHASLRTTGRLCTCCTPFLECPPCIANFLSLCLFYPTNTFKCYLRCHLFCEIFLVFVLIFSHFCSPYQFVSASIRTRHFVVNLKYVSDLLSTMSLWRAGIVPYLFSFFSSVPSIGPGINQVVPMQRLRRERQDKAGLSPRRSWMVGNYTNRDLVICSKAWCSILVGKASTQLLKTKKSHCKLVLANYQLRTLKIPCSDPEL